MYVHMNVPIVSHVQRIEILFVRTVVEIYKNVPNVRKNWMLINMKCMLVVLITMGSPVIGEDKKTVEFSIP